MRIKIKKLRELPDAKKPGNIEEGWEKEFEIPDENYKPPTVGKRFYGCLWWSTSIVQEVIDDRTFRTLNSVYQYEADEEVR